MAPDRLTHEERMAEAEKERKKKRNDRIEAGSQGIGCCAAIFDCCS
jgi:hypothetical protein